MRRLALSCLAALLAVLGLSAASSERTSEAQALQPARVSVVGAAPGTSVGVGDGLEPTDLAAGISREEEREPTFLAMVALAATAAGLGASVRLHTAARRRTG